MSSQLLNARWSLHKPLRNCQDPVMALKVSLCFGSSAGTRHVAPVSRRKAEQKWPPKPKQVIIGPTHGRTQMQEPFTPSATLFSNPGRTDQCIPRGGEEKGRKQGRRGGVGRESTSGWKEGRTFCSLYNDLHLDIPRTSGSIVYRLSDARSHNTHIQQQRWAQLLFASPLLLLLQE